MIITHQLINKNNIDQNNTMNASIIRKNINKTFQLIKIINKIMM